MMKKNCIGERTKISVIESRRMRWVGHMARVGEKEVRTLCEGNPIKEKDRFGDLVLFGLQI